jgi:hypothetical protein
MKRVVAPLFSLVIIIAFFVACAGTPPTEDKHTDSDDHGVSSKNLPREIREVV